MSVYIKQVSIDYRLTSSRNKGQSGRGSWSGWRGRRPGAAAWRLLPPASPRLRLGRVWTGSQMNLNDLKRDFKPTWCQHTNYQVKQAHIVQRPGGQISTAIMATWINLLFLSEMVMTNWFLLSFRWQIVKWLIFHNYLSSNHPIFHNNKTIHNGSYLVHI